MAVTTYYSVGGEIMAERSGSTRTDYARDALGSVIGTKRVSGILNQPGLTNTYRYKPYGERLAKTGTAPDPKFQWNGTSGYRQTPIPHSASYVRRRHYSQEEGRWTTAEPISFRMGQTYVEAKPTRLTDSSGLTPDNEPYITSIIIPPYRPLHCVCRPTARIKGGTSLPGNLLNCMTKHCKIYCDAVKDPETTAIAECPIFDWIIPGPEVAISFIKCRETNEKYKPCTVINNPKWWKHCGELFSVAGQGYNTGSANANKSNYPFPACQVDIFSGTVLCDLTGEFCCVECRMRSCCATGSFNDFLKRLMIDDIKTHCFRRRF